MAEMKTKDMIKVLKAIEKHEKIERRFKSTEYNYVWEDCCDEFYPNFKDYDYRVKDVKTLPKIRIAKMIYSLNQRGVIYYVIADNKELADRIENTFADFDSWASNWIESSDANVNSAPVPVFWSVSSLNTSTDKVDVKLLWG